MVSVPKNKFLSETFAYIILWAIIFALPIVLEVMEEAMNKTFLWNDVLFFWLGLIPFVVFFIIHNYVVKKVLFKSNYSRYIIITTVLFIIFFIFVWYDFEYRLSPHAHRFRPPTNLPPGAPQPPHGDKPPMIHLVVLVKGVSALMMVGFNLAIAQMYHSLDDKARRAELERYQMQMELRSLKAQVSPHFLMNMLNNIHACVDKDAQRAQTMIIELSKLMRYVLYDAEKSTVPLSSEVQFIENYISMMSNRYSPDKVKILCHLPASCPPDFMVPPLIFIPFVENCFKHGVTYLKESEINVSIQENNGFVFLRCSNFISHEHSDHPSGVGLENVKKRLILIYGDKYTLDINDDGSIFSINLMIPNI